MSNWGLVSRIRTARLRSGLDINNPAQKYSLRSMSGKFSGMQLVSYMFVGMRQLAPDMEPGIDLTKEYQHALELGGKV